MVVGVVAISSSRSSKSRIVQALLQNPNSPETSSLVASRKLCTQASPIRNDHSHSHPFSLRYPSLFWISKAGDLSTHRRKATTSESGGSDAWLFFLLCSSRTIPVRLLRLPNLRCMTVLHLTEFSCQVRAVRFYVRSSPPKHVEKKAPRAQRCFACQDGVDRRSHIVLCSPGLRWISVVSLFSFRLASQGCTGSVHMHWISASLFCLECQDGAAWAYPYGALHPSVWLDQHSLFVLRTPRLHCMRIWLMNFA